MAEVEIDLEKTHRDLIQIKKARSAHNAFLKELGHPQLVGNSAPGSFWIEGQALTWQTLPMVTETD
jgi:hypothetical protein